MKVINFLVLVSFLIVASFIVFVLYPLFFSPSTQQKPVETAPFQVYESYEGKKHKKQKRILYLVEKETWDPKTFNVSLLPKNHRMVIMTDLDNIDQMSRTLGNNFYTFEKHNYTHFKEEIQKASVVMYKLPFKKNEILNSIAFFKKNINPKLIVVPLLENSF
jgi:hypothetical protein